MHTAYRVLPLDPHYTHRTRDSGRDAQEQTVERLVAEGGEPLRDQLRRARPGERLLLASYSPFAQPGPFREFGPIYLLESAAAAAPLPRLPISPAHDYFIAPFVLRGYSSAQRIVDAVVTPLEQAEDNLQRLLSNPAIDYVHARFAAYGCFACRIEREH